MNVMIYRWEDGISIRRCNLPRITKLANAESKYFWFQHLCLFHCIRLCCLWKIFAFLVFYFFHHWWDLCLWFILNQNYTETITLMLLLPNRKLCYHSCGIKHQRFKKFLPFHILSHVNSDRTLHMEITTYSNSY